MPRPECHHSPPSVPAATMPPHMYMRMHTYACMNTTTSVTPLIAASRIVLPQLLRRPITGLAALLSGTAIIAACCLPRCLRRCCRRSTEDHGTTNPARRPRRRNGRGGEDDGTSESGYGRGRRRKGGLHGTAEEAAALYREQGHREGDVEGDVRANMAAADQSSEDEDEGEDEAMRAPAKGGKRCMRGTGATYPTDEAAAAAKLLIAANIDDDRAGGGAASSAAQGHERVTLYVQRADNGYEELPASLPVRSSQGDDLTVGEMVVHALDLVGRRQHD